MKQIPRILAAIITICLAMGLSGCSEGQKISQSPPTAYPTRPNSTRVEFLIPEIPAQDQLGAELPEDPGGWVFTNYQQTLSWYDQTQNYCVCSLTLPAITPAAGFALDFNSRMMALGNEILQEIRTCQQQGYSPSTLSLTYSTVFREDMLFVILDRLYADGVTEKYIYALDTQEKQLLPLGDISYELVDMDYPIFLIAATDLVRQAYIREYSATVAAMEQEYQASLNSMSPQPPDPRIEIYYTALEKLPYSAFQLSHLRLFPDPEGEVLLYCAIPTLAEEMYVPRVIRFDTRALSWEQVPNDAQGYGQLFDLQHYVAAADADLYSAMLLEAFVSDSEDFARYAATESADSVTLITGSIARAAGKEYAPLLRAACLELLAEDDLTGAERDLVNTLLAAIK